MQFLAHQRTKVLFRHAAVAKGLRFERGSEGGRRRRCDRCHLGCVGKVVFRVQPLPAIAWCCETCSVRFLKLGTVGVASIPIKNTTCQQDQGNECEMLSCLQDVPFEVLFRGERTLFVWRDPPGKGFRIFPVCLT